MPEVSDDATLGGGTTSTPATERSAAERGKGNKRSLSCGIPNWQISSIQTAGSAPAMNQAAAGRTGSAACLRWSVSVFTGRD